MTIALFIVLFFLSAFFSASETILFSLTDSQRQRIASRNVAAGAQVSECLRDSALLLSTLLVGNTLVNFAIAAIGYRVFAAWLPRGGALSVPVMTVALLFFGEITPKQIALRYAEELAAPCARLLLFWRRVLAPFNFLLKSASRAFSGALRRERRALSDAELLSVLEASAERGEFLPEDAKMIEGVLRLSELSANDEMTPRVDMQTYDVDLQPELRDALVASSRHRYLPVINRSPDIVMGIYDCETGQTEDALFIPETVTLDDLLVTFRRSGKSVAIVLDEYGGTAGLISLDDILELMFGPQVFSRPDAEPFIVKKGPRVWEIDARANLDEVSREIGLELEAEDADRLSGWVAMHAERLPHVGQQVEADGCRVTILKRRHRRVALVRLEIIAPPKVETDAEILAETDEAAAKAEEDAS